MGSPGRTGGAVARRLLAAGRPVRVIGRSAARLQPLVDLGATPAAGDVADPAFLASAFEGAETVYAMVPPDYAQPDLRRHYNRLGESIAAALIRARIDRVVFLSSLGAELEAGTGPIAGLHDVESRLASLGIDVLNLRPGYFYENLYAAIGQVKQRGVNGGAIEPDAPVTMTATGDIGGAAAARGAPRRRVRRRGRPRAARPARLHPDRGVAHPGTGDRKARPSLRADPGRGVRRRPDAGGLLEGRGAGDGGAVPGAERRTRAFAPGTHAPDDDAHDARDAGEWAAAYRAA
jgi:uncharacterized protein YbjT (DUF2867 family)